MTMYRGDEDVQGFDQSKRCPVCRKGWIGWTFWPDSDVPLSMWCSRHGDKVDRCEFYVILTYEEMISLTIDEVSRSYTSW